MFEAVDSPFLVPFDGSFRVADFPTDVGKKFQGEKRVEKVPDKKELEKLLADEVERLDELQRILYAHDHHSVLLVFQAMDAAGKDGTIRAVTSGIDPAGFQVFSFKQPSAEELDHDFLWRTTRRLPERGRIGIFNRSYYEEVLVVRVHPEFLEAQRLPDRLRGEALWQERFESIRDHEKHLARSGTVILKFWLNVSKDEQRERFLARIDEPEKNWKFAAGDVRERQHWDAYMHAYEEALRATSRPWAPWYAIPADDKAFMRWTVAQIFRRTLESLGLAYPTLGEAEEVKMKEMRGLLDAEDE